MENEEEDDYTKDENYEPQINSKNPTERILARRLRIDRRVEALRKQKEAQEAEGDNATVEPEFEKTPIEFQVEKSIELLEKLILEGDEYVTNVRIATEAREANRRERDGINKEKLIKELEDEAQAAADKFNEIADKWAGILKYNDPLHINDDITSQKEKCDELIKQKDAIIANLKEKLRKEEVNFAVDQRKQVEDVNSISRRIENQIIVMRKAYRQELKMIEDVILAERNLLIEANNKKWDELYKKRDQEEKANSELKSEDYWNFVKEMDNLNRDFQELYRETTIKLENDCDELQRELERIKKDAVMNSEKLDYNYQILKKREDENLIIRSQQKRRINKLQDVINSLRKKNNDYYTQTSQQIEKLTEEVKKLSQNVLDVEKKADHMAAVNDEKFQKIWNMNKRRADQLFKRVLDIDKVLYEQQLGLIWEPIDHTLPNKNEMESYKIAVSRLDATTSKMTKSVASVKSIASPAAVKEREKNLELENENNPVYIKIIKHIMGLIADKTGFLLEEELNRILEPYLECERTLIKVDNLFAALSIKERGDIDVLLEYFIPYMFCPVCNMTEKPVCIMTTEDECLMKVHDIDPMNIAELDPQDESVKVVNEQTLIDKLREESGIDQLDEGGTLIEFGPLSAVIYDEHLKGDCRGPDVLNLEQSKHSDDPTLPTEHFKIKIPCQYHHPLMISSVYVLRALKDFLAKSHIPKALVPNMSARLAHKRSTISRMMAEEDIQTYWGKYTTIFPTERKQLWDSLLEGLKKYHELLKVRKTASEEVVSLRKQNTDLRRVFANYIDKKDIPY